MLRRQKTAGVVPDPYSNRSSARNSGASLQLVSSATIGQKPPRTARPTRHHPSPQKPSLTKAENTKLFELHQIFGCHWKQISENFPGKNDNTIKNLFFAQIRKSLRKAKKLSQNFSSPEAVNNLKPRVLSSFLMKELALPEDLRNSEKSFPWLSPSSIMVRQFIIFFAFLKPSELQTINDQKLTKIIDFIFSELEEMNKLYCESREVVNPPPPHVSGINGQTTESMIQRTVSMRMLAGEFRFHLKRIENDLRGLNPDKSYLIESFEKMSDLSSKISNILKANSESKNEMRELATELSLLEHISQPLPPLPLNLPPTQITVGEDSFLPRGVAPLFPAENVRARASQEIMRHSFIDNEDMFRNPLKDEFARGSLRWMEGSTPNRTDLGGLDFGGDRDLRGSFEKKSGLELMRINSRFSGTGTGRESFKK